MVLNTIWAPKDICRTLLAKESQSVQNLLHMTSQYNQHVSGFLSTSTLEIHFFDIQQWLDSLVDEAFYRSGPCTDLPEYMTSRKRTMGLEPFWSLLQPSMCGTSPISSMVESLQDQLSLITGLQNDLVGLEKDVATGDRMNCILVAAGQPQTGTDACSIDALRSHITETIEQHNQATCKAVRQWRAIERSAKNLQEVEFACQVLMFSNRYLQWMAASKRFKVQTS